MRRRTHGEPDAPIVEVEFGELIGHALAQRRYFPEGSHRETAQLLQNRIAQDGHFGQAAGVAQHLVADGTAFGGIAVENRCGCALMPHKRELPGEIEGILHPRVHALAAGGAMNMRRIAAQEYSTLPVAPYFS